MGSRRGADAVSGHLDRKDLLPLDVQPFDVRFVYFLCLYFDFLFLFSSFSFPPTPADRHTRITLRQNIAVMMVAAYVIVGFVLMEILYLAVWCRPFHQYWAVPPDNGNKPNPYLPKTTPESDRLP